MIEGAINELSSRRAHSFIDPVANDDTEAKQLMSTLVLCVSEGFRLKYLTALRMDKNFSSLEIAPGYPIAKWRNDPSANRDERTLFRSFTTASPYLEIPVQEVTFKGAKAAGLASCVAANSIAVSWASEQIWHENEIPIEILTIAESGELVESESSVRNVSFLAHWQAHAPWIRSSYSIAVNSGAELLERVSRLFPHLRFGPLAISHLRTLKGSEKHFGWVIKSLESANAEVSGWVSGPFPHNRLPGPASGESESVHASQRLKSMRIFETDQGIQEFMEHHMKNNAENKRIYYILDPGRRYMIIGYVGDHLPTANY